MHTSEVNPGIFLVNHIRLLLKLLIIGSDNLSRVMDFFSTKYSLSSTKLPEQIRYLKVISNVISFCYFIIEYFILLRIFYIN
jgi:hypothetical protein